MHVTTQYHHAKKENETNSWIESEQPLNFGMNLSEFMDSAIRFKIQ